MKRWMPWVFWPRRQIRRFPSDRSIRAFWPIIVAVFRFISRGAPRFSGVKKSVTIVRGNPRYERGKNLDDFAVNWASECWADIPQQVLSSGDLADRLEDDSLVLILYSWLQDFRYFSRAASLLEVIKLSSLLNKKKSSVLVFLPDTCKVANSFFAGLLVSLSDGKIVLAQNSQASARFYGLERCLTPALWLWAEDSMVAWSNIKPLSARPRKVSFAVTGDPRRVELFNEWATVFERNGFQVWPTGDLEDYRDYIKAARNVRIVVTTCYLQERFIIGPLWYRRRLPSDTVTGRVWEAFASKSLLLCNDNPELRAFGFLPGQHFLNLPNGESSAGWELPSESVLQSIATEGHEHFCQLRKESMRAMEGLVQLE